MGLETAIAIIGVCLAAATFFIGRYAANKTEGKTEGMIMSELGYLKSNTDEIKERMAKQEDRYITINSEIAEVKKDIKNLYRLIDDIKETK